MKSFRQSVFKTPAAKRAFGRRLRDEPTKHECLLWGALDSLGPNRYFLFQQRLFGFFPDFQFPDAKLIVEVDGDYHNVPAQRERDAYRDSVFREHGYDIFRIDNKTVEDDPFKAAAIVLGVEHRRYEQFSEPARRVSLLPSKRDHKPRTAEQRRQHREKRRRKAAKKIKWWQEPIPPPDDKNLWS